METFEQLYQRMTKAQLSSPAKCGDLLKVMETVLAANKALRQRIDRIESGGIKYVGTWQRSGDYERGTFVTHKGYMWHAVCPTSGDEPGKSDAWQLAVKAGRDAR